MSEHAAASHPKAESKGGGGLEYGDIPFFGTLTGMMKKVFNVSGLEAAGDMILGFLSGGGGGGGKAAHAEH